MNCLEYKKTRQNYIPAEFYLSRNNPDPFNEKTMINYYLPRKEKIKIEILDYEGKKVKTLVNEIKDGGFYQIEFYANRLKEGIYIYTMIAGRFAMERRMLYLK